MVNFQTMKGNVFGNMSSRLPYKPFENESFYSNCCVSKLGIVFLMILMVMVTNLVAQSLTISVEMVMSILRKEIQGGA
jgi:hypothetical protein